MPDEKRPVGLYELPVTEQLQRQIEALEAEFDCATVSPDPHQAIALLGGALGQRIEAALSACKGKDAAARLTKQIALANRVLEVLAEQRGSGTSLVEDGFVDPASELRSIWPRKGERLGTPEVPSRPSVPLSGSALLVNGRNDRALAPEICRELGSADRVDILCAFVRRTGLNLVKEELRQFAERRPGQLRVLTTAYLSSTERVALDALRELGAQICVSYDVSSTRLHAKAWLFRRDSGFSTAYIGSSNMTYSAMVGGQEWNVRLSERDNDGVLSKFQTTFDQYWDDDGFVPYETEDDAKRFDEAVNKQIDDRSRLLLAFDIQPRPYQQEILDRLAAERAQHFTRNLVVAATGTGKTIVAALDYRRLCKEAGRPLSLLFVAHSREILEQSMTTFQVVMRQASFGARLHSGFTPANDKHVFASIQSLDKDRVAALKANSYDVLIVDEFHHAAADSYDRLLEKLDPQVLLGLTATPERADGKSVLRWFNWRTAYELRLWKALDQGMLSPFHYYGVAGPDIRRVTFSRGKYSTDELSNVYTKDDALMKRVLEQIYEKVPDLEGMRALGFCVSVAHAKFMAARFNKHGIASEVILGETKSKARAERLRRLRDGDLKVVFVVDAFNEGVDVPDVNTLLFLRPTESATIFLQQLGRGLRRVEDKVCIVLDFIGFANERFRFDARFRALLGGTRKSTARQVELDFPQMPAGCSIKLDPFAKAAVMANIKQSLALGRRGLADDLRTLGPSTTLAEFLRKAEVDLEDVYSGGGHCWTTLRRAAGFDAPNEAEEDPRIQRALARMLHIDDLGRLDAFKSLLARAKPPKANPDDAAQRMLFVLMGFMRSSYEAMSVAWDHVWGSPAMLDEARALVGQLKTRVGRLTPVLTGELAAIPLRIHATYALDEIMAAVDERASTGGVKRIQTGVFYAKEHRADLLFVTLEKSEDDYSPTTLYKDYPMTRRRFHWETQSNCHAGTKTGARYLRIERESGNHALLFVRQRRTDSRRQTMPYLFFGPAFHAAHRGAKPMSVEWELEHPIPAAYFQEIKVAAG